MRHTSSILAAILGVTLAISSHTQAQTAPAPGPAVIAAAPAPKGQEASSALLRGNVAQALALYTRCTER
jgi:hypothetical protein